MGLRNIIFRNYNKTQRPVKNYSDNVVLNYGIEVYGLNYFNQKAETIEFNVLITQQWKDEYIVWNDTEYATDVLKIDSLDIWNPDLELYNSGKKPFSFSGDNSKLKVYSDGRVLWSRFATYTFSCMLNLKDFPYDKQTCHLLFGSWKHSKAQLDLKPFTNESSFRDISVYSEFSHNEWDISKTFVSHMDIEYLCCPGELYPNTEFYIELERHSMKYTIVIIFAVFITLSGFAVSFVSITNYKRTFVLIFVPLSIIWLQIYISDKIPVIRYETLMERFFILCFSSTMTLSLESALLYCILTNSYIPKKKININHENIYTVKFIKDNNDTIFIEHYLLYFDYIVRVVTISVYFILMINILIN